MYTIGIDLGGTNIAVGLCDENLTIIDKTSVRTRGYRPADEIVADMANVSRELIERNGLTANDIEYVGIAIPGAVVPEKGMIEFTSNLPFIEYPIADEFRKLLPVSKILINNDDVGLMKITYNRHFDLITVLKEKKLLNFSRLSK